ncbi:MAG: hypothetical protein VW644_04660 [Alphaproteobacteria bacterium]|jgi:hypothetical protein
MNRSAGRATIIAALAALVLAALPAAAQTADGQSAGTEPGQLVYRLMFDDYETGSVEDWLKAKGFVFEQDAKDRDKIDFNVSGEEMFVEARRKAFGFISN